MWIRKKIKELESNLDHEASFNEYTKYKKDLELIYERIAEGVKIRSKCFFLTIEAPIPQNGQTLEQFVGNLSMNCLRMFNHFVKLALKGLISKTKTKTIR